MRKSPRLRLASTILILVLNGLKSTKMKKKSELRGFLRSVTYVLGDGIETRRHTSWSAAHGVGGPKTWRTIALATSEKSFDEIAADANDTRLDGERARSINVAAIEPGGSIIDIFPKDAPAEGPKRIEWVRNQVVGLRAACARHHGVALKPYVQHILGQDRKRLKSEILEARDEFVDAVKHLITTDAVNHAGQEYGDHLRRRRSDHQGRSATAF